MFVRGGVVLPAAWSSDGVLTVTADGTAERLAGRPLDDGRLFFDWAWEPCKRYTLESLPRGSSSPSRRVLTAPVRPEPFLVA